MLLSASSFCIKLYTKSVLHIAIIICVMFMLICLCVCNEAPLLITRDSVLVLNYFPDKENTGEESDDPCDLSHKLLSKVLSTIKGELWLPFAFFLCFSLQCFFPTLSPLHHSSSSSLLVQGFVKQRMASLTPEIYWLPPRRRR